MVFSQRLSASGQDSPSSSVHAGHHDQNTRIMPYAAKYLSSPGPSKCTLAPLRL